MIAEIFLGLGLDLASTFLVVPALTYAALFFVRRRPNDRIWSVRRSVFDFFRPQSAPPTTVISTSGFAEVNGHPRPQTGTGQVRAIAILAPSIARAYSAPIDNDRLRMSEDCNLTDPIFAQDLLLIGGPSTNQVTRDILALIVDQLPAGIGFADDADGKPRLIQWRNRTHGWSPDRMGGLIIRCANPLSDGSHTLTIVAGQSTYGTEGAAQALVTSPKTRGRWWNARFKTGYVALVEVELLPNPSKTSRIRRIRRVMIPDSNHLTIPWTNDPDH